ncbi:hypothetical protein PAAL109150_20580 [Paenibacillus alkaliterrae]
MPSASVILFNGAACSEGIFLSAVKFTAGSAIDESLRS